MTDARLDLAIAQRFPDPAMRLRRASYANLRIEPAVRRA